MRPSAPRSPPPRVATTLPEFEHSARPLRCGQRRNRHPPGPNFSEKSPAPAIYRRAPRARFRLRPTLFFATPTDRRPIRPGRVSPHAMVARVRPNERLLLLSTLAISRSWRRYAPPDFPFASDRRRRRPSPVSVACGRRVRTAEPGSRRILFLIRWRPAALRPDSGKSHERYLHSPPFRSFWRCPGQVLAGQLTLNQSINTIMAKKSPKAVAKKSAAKAPAKKAVKTAVKKVAKKK